MNKKETTGLVAALGVGAALFLLTRKSTAKTKGETSADGGSDGPPIEDDTEDIGEDDQSVPDGQSSTHTAPSKKNAPPLNNPETAFAVASDAMAALGDEANTAAQNQRSLDDPLFSGPIFEATASERQAAREALQVPAGQSLAVWIADQAYFAVGGEKIPKVKNRGKGWDPWIILWSDLHDAIKGYLIPGLDQ